MSQFLNNDDNSEQSRRLMLALVASLAVFVLYEAFLAPTPPTPAAVAEGSAEVGDGASLSSATPTTMTAPRTEGSGAAAPVPALPPQRLVTDNTEIAFSNLGGRLAGVEILAPTQYIPHEDMTGVFPAAADAALLSAGLTIGGLPDLRADSPYELDLAASQPDPAHGADAFGTVAYRWRSPDGAIEVRRTWTPSENPFGTTSVVEIENLGTAERRFDGVEIAASGHFDPDARTSLFGAPTSVLEAVCSTSERTHRKIAAKVQARVFPGDVVFVGVNEHYFLNAISVAPGTSAECHFARYAEDEVGAALRTQPFSVAPGQTHRVELLLYTGPKDTSFLRPFDRDLTASINLGWFSFLAIPMREAIVFFHGLIPNWGIAILLLTLTVKLLLFPVTQKAFQSMEKMRELQPRLSELQKKYENDRMKLADEQMKLFRESGTSPFGGCLPMLLQMPIYIALYRTIQGSTELFNAPFVLWIQDLSAADPYFVLPILMGITMFLQNRLMPQPTDNPQMVMVQRIMPIMFTAFMLFLPSGLVLYIFCNMLLSIAQQLHIRRSMEKRRAAASARA